MKMLNARLPAGRVGLLCALLAAALSLPASAHAQPYTRADSTHYSLYYEAFKAGSYAEALPNLLWILDHAPAFPGGTDNNFERAVTAYTHLAEAAAAPEARRAYLDSALVMMDRAVPTLKDAGAEVDAYTWTLNKGRFIQQHKDDLADLQAAAGALYRAAYALDPQRPAPYYIDYIIRDYLQQDDREAALAFMAGLEETRHDAEALAELIGTWRDHLFTDPDERIAFLEAQRGRKPDDVALLTDLLELYMEQGYRDAVYAAADRLMALEPSAHLYRLIAQMHLDDGAHDEAIAFYQQSLDMDEGRSAARDVYFNMGVAHEREGRLARARTAFRAALAIDHQFGRAYYAIGELYVQAVANCNSFERQDRTVYWLATDYFERAQRVDPTLKTVATQRILSLQASYPSPGDLHFANWQAGAPHRIDAGVGACYEWINETTNVRPATSSGS